MTHITDLESLWDGPLFRLRSGELLPADVDEVLGVLQSIRIDDAESVIDRQLVSLLWYLPLFADWQSARVAKRGGDLSLLSRFVDGVTNEVERLLGVP